MKTNPTHLKLRELLDANERFDLSAKGTTNHCPMALIALAEMGASEDRLQAFFEMWEREYALIAPPVESVISRHEWTQHLGDRAAFGALRRCFLEWIADDGATPVITAVLQAVPFAPATQAFHSLIRLAYGIEAGHNGEIAAGLASFISSHMPIDVTLSGRLRAESIEAGFDRVAEAMNGVTLPRDSITARVRAVATHERFAGALLAPPATSTLLDDLAQATIHTYWGNQNFTLLHTVTATRAARIVFALLPDSLVNRLMPSLWIALCAANAGVGRLVHADVERPDRSVEWSDLCRLAITSNDDHVIKMTYTCFCEDRRSSSPLYLASAARLLGVAAI